MKTLLKAYGQLNKLEVLAPVADLGIRLWLFYVFFAEGRSKIIDFDSTIALFKYEYNVPLLPPELAAYLATIGELCLPVLLLIGLASRLSAVGLFILNVVAVISYSHFLFAPENVGALYDHVLWGILILAIMSRGAGKLSLDYLLCKKSCNHSA